MFRRPFTVRRIGSAINTLSSRERLLRKMVSPKTIVLDSDSVSRRAQLIRVAGIFLGVGCFLAVVLLALAVKDLPEITNIAKLTAAQSSVILDRNGKILYTLHGEENRTAVPLSQISAPVAQATLAIEDDQFYEHGGFDVGGILKAVCHEIGLCSEARGGSTITQQFIKNAFLTSEHSYARKLKELILSIQLESRFTKDQILELYLNRIPYGSNAFGVERASQTFFNKPASQITLAEAAVLASIPKAPTYYSPYGENLYSKFEVNPEILARHGIQDESDVDPNLISVGLLGKAYSLTDDLDEVHSIYLKGRVDFVLERMEKLGLITSAQKDQALLHASRIVFTPYREPMLAPHFVTYVRQLLEARYGKEQIEKGGLRVTTTLDLDLQNIAQKTVEAYAQMNQDRYHASNSSLFATDPRTGEILAMVGSRDYWNDEIKGKVNVALSPRQPGSSFKPIVYAAAFMQGYAPSTLVYDVKLKFSDSYSPDNYDGKFRGPVSFRQALANSLNIPAIQAAYFAGVPTVLNLARNLGLRLNQPDDWYGLSLALGAGEVRLMDLVAAYGVFANGGYRVEPFPILKVEDIDGNILEEYMPSPQREQILDPEVAYLVNNVLSDSGARPEGFWRDQLTIPGQVSGAKTGTSNIQKKNLNYNPANPDSKSTRNVPFDAWTIGYTRRLAAGVWSGNSDGETPLAAKADGLGAASRIWHDFMVAATAKNPREEFDVPSGIKWIKVSKLSGKLPSKYTPADQIVSEVFASFAPPRLTDDSYKVVMVDRVSGKLATEYTPKEALQELAIYDHHSPFPDKPEWEEPVLQWAKENVDDTKVPTEYDDVHTVSSMGQKPDITITAPISSGEVSGPTVGVWVSVSAAAGVERVEYFWDDVLLDTALAPPYKGTLLIPTDLPLGSRHTIGAKVFDGLYRTGFSSIEVVIGEDRIPPAVTILSPDADARVMADSTMAVEVDAHDLGSDIAAVDIYLDNALQGTLKKAPYLFLIPLSTVTGERHIRVMATDGSGNTKTDEINVFANISTTVESKSVIVSPMDNAQLSVNSTVLVNLAVASEVRPDLKSLILLTKDKNGRAEEVYSSGVLEQRTSRYTLPWFPAKPGNYQLYAKMTLRDGSVRFTNRVEVLVR